MLSDWRLGSFGRLLYADRRVCNDLFVQVLSNELRPDGVKPWIRKDKAEMKKCWHPPRQAEARVGPIVRQHRRTIGALAQGLGGGRIYLALAGKLTVGVHRR
jgi:hypothetical protein